VDANRATHHGSSVIVISEIWSNKDAHGNEFLKPTTSTMRYIDGRTLMALNSLHHYSSYPDSLHAVNRAIRDTPIKLGSILKVILLFEIDLVKRALVRVNKFLLIL